MIDSIKKICIDVISDLTFADALVGEVISDNPISIRISDKLVLSQNQIILSKNVSDFAIEINQNPEFLNDIKNPIDFKNKKTCFIYNKLKIGESVILFKTAGGQKYFVFDRVLEVIL